jgi:predicted acyl esterase
MAMMRLRRNQRRVAAALPLTEAYPAALGGRSDFFEQWLTDPDPASPCWTSRDLTSATANLAVPVSLITGWDDPMCD